MRTQRPVREKSFDDLGDLQKAVMEIVWEMGEATVHQARDRLGGRKKPAYTTILTIMQKLERGGWLKHRTQGRTYVYSPVHSRREAGSRSLRQFIQRVFRGDPAMMFQHLIEDEELSEEELAEFKRIIDERRKEGAR